MRDLASADRRAIGGRAVKHLWDDDELAAERTLEPNYHSLLANKAGPTRLGFTVLLTFFRHEGRFPTSKHEVPPASQFCSENFATVDR
jgi:hypothetical protein